MKRSTRRWFVVAGLVALACAGAFFHSARNTDKRAAASQQAIDANFDRIRKDLPVGSRYDDVLSYLQVHNDSFYEDPSRGEERVVYVDLGTRPSTVWYCSRFSGYAKLSFMASSLDRAALEMRGVDCL